MVDTAKLETEAKAIAAETESAISSLLGMLTPRWDRFVVVWKAEATRKKFITVAVAAVGIWAAWYFGLNVMRFGVGGFRAAYSYGHGTEVTKADIQAGDATTLANAKAMFATRAQFNDLETKVHTLETRLGTIEKKPAPAQITAGSLQEKKKSEKRKVLKKSSFSVINPSTWP